MSIKLMFISVATACLAVGCVAFPDDGPYYGGGGYSTAYDNYGGYYNGGYQTVYHNYNWDSDRIIYRNDRARWDRDRTMQIQLQQNRRKYQNAQKRPQWNQNQEQNGRPNWQSRPQPSTQPNWTNRPQQSTQPTWSNRPQQNDRPNWQNRPQQNGQADQGRWNHNHSNSQTSGQSNKSQGSSQPTRNKNWPNKKDPNDQN